MLYLTLAVVIRFPHTLQTSFKLKQKIFLMLAMVLVATALTRITFAHARPSNDGDFHSLLSKKVFSEDDMTPDFTEQLGKHDHESDIKKRNHVVHEKYDQPQKINEKKIHRPAVNGTDDNKKRSSSRNEEVDVVDREDHVTQYLADLLVNTDSEITSLQASEPEEDVRDSLEIKEDQFFAFLTGQEKTLEVEGNWLQPTLDDLKNDDYLSNVIADDN